MKEYLNFNYNMRTDIHFGRGAENEAGKLIRKYGGTKAMMVYGGGSIKKNGLYDRVVKSLQEENIPLVEFGGVKPNPLRSYAEKGLKLAQDQQVDFLLGVGGGSAIDTAKAIALGLAAGGDFWPFYSGTMPTKIFPVGTIHTIAAAGSENSRSSVLMDDVESGYKRGCFWEVCRPVFAIMNPELTFTVDAFQTGAGTADIFAHTLGRYFMRGYSALSDEFAEGLLRTVVKYGPLALKEPDNYEARAELMLSGSFSHNDLTGLGRAFPLAGEHGLESMFSGYYDTAHGAGLAVLMPAMLEYFVNHGNADQIARIAQFGAKVFGIPAGDPKTTALQGIRSFKAWIKELGMPQTLKDLGIPKNDLEDAVQRCLDRNGGMIKGYMDMDKAAVTEIFRSVLE